MAVLCAGVVAAAVAGCGSDDNSSAPAAATGASSSSAAGSSGDANKPVNIALFLVATANTHQQASRTGVEQAIKKAGNAKVRVFGAEFDPKKQISQVEAATASGQFDAMIVNPVDGPSITPAVTKAIASGAKVVCAFAVCGTDQKFGKHIPGLVAQVSADYSAIGTAMATALTKGCAGINPCKTVYIDGAPTLGVEKLITKAFNAYVAKQPNIKVVAHGVGQYLAPPAYKSMKDVLQANPDIDAVASPGDQMISGARQALDESPLKNKKVVLVGDGASTLGLKGIMDGTWYASAVLRPRTEGFDAATAAINAVRGTGPIKELVNSSATEGIPELYVTKANAADFQPEWPG